DWPMMGQIASSWVISPLMGGVIAAAFLAFIKAKVNDVEDKIAAARFWVPILIGIMAGAFSAYLIAKGLRRIIEVSLGHALILGLIIGVVTLIAFRPIIHRKSEGMENRKRSLKALFGLPLIVSAALLS